MTGVILETGVKGMKVLLVCLQEGVKAQLFAKALQAGTKEGLDIQVDECGTQKLLLKKVKRIIKFLL